MNRGTISFLILLISWSSLATAQYFQADFMKKRLLEREGGRWTISDWLGQKSKVRFADLWLTQNTESSVWELDLGSNYADLDRETSINSVVTEESVSRWTHSLDLFFHSLGVRGQFEDEKDRNATLVEISLRLLGTSQQGTRLNLGYGWRRLEIESTKENWNQQFARLDTNIYISHFLGLEADYAYHIKTASSLKREMDGYKLTYGVFLEFGMLRIFAHSLVEEENVGPSQSNEKIESKGFEYGAKLFF